MAQPFWLQFAPFPVCPRTTIYYVRKNKNVHGFQMASVPSTRDWDKAIVLKLAARAISKQYCLSDPAKRESELYCVGKLKNRSPKIICSLELCSQFLLFFKGVRELALRARFFGYFLCFKTKKVTLIWGPLKPKTNPQIHRILTSKKILRTPSGITSYIT
jgi:hypothetical protein